MDGITSQNKLELLDEYLAWQHRVGSYELLRWFGNVSPVSLRSLYLNAQTLRDILHMEWGPQG
jgi:hypothetical protein